MRTVTVTEASRVFADLLDAIAAGDTVIITRDNRSVAEMRPTRASTGRNLQATLQATTPPDDQFAADIAEAVSGLVTENADTWADA